MENKWGEIAVIAMVGLFIGIVLWGSAKSENSESTAKLDACVELSNEMGLDPNDEKIEFIKNCFEQ